MDFTKITNGIKTAFNVVKPYAEKALKTAGGLLIVSAGKELLEKIGFDTTSITTSSSNVVSFTPSSQAYSPEGSRQEAMYAIYRSSLRMTSDHYRLEEASKITDIANSGEDADKLFASKLLGDMANKMSSHYYVDNITEYIRSLV